MGKLLRWLLVLAVVLGIGFLIWKTSRPKPVEVGLQVVTKGVVEKIVANTRAGTVNACRRAKLSPSIGGQIAGLPVKEGDYVRAGDLLLEIWNEDLKAQLTLAGLEVSVARARMEAACFSADEADRVAKRAETLFLKKVGTEEATDQAVTLAKSSRAQCRASIETVQMQEARVALSEANLSRTRLFAPFSGVVAKIEGELSEYVTPSPVGVQTPPVIDLIENSCYYVSAPIDEVDAALIRIGMEARISLDAFRDRVFPGKIKRIAPYVLDYEKQARTVEIEVEFAGEESFGELLAGYSADVEVIISTAKGALMIPTEAILENRWVYLYMEEEARAQKIEVQPGLSNWEVTEVVSGLQEGQQVVINVDNPALAEGVSVTVAGEAGERP